MNLNMNRVASVTLLKDAASTAIYGSKAANGVVVIETKAPVKGKLQISYKGDYSLDFADLSDYNLTNSREKLEFEKLAGVYKDNTNDPFNQIKLDNLYNSRLRDIEQGVDTYWLSVPLRTGFTHKHNVYAEGGEGNVRYGLGLNFGQVNGVMKGSDRQTLGGNLDLIYRTGKFQFSNKLSIDYLETNNPTVSFSEYAYANPYYRKYGADGKINKYLYYPEEGLNDNPVSNPLWNAHLNNYDKGQRFGFTNNFIAEWFATDDLRVRGKFGITKYDDTQDKRLSPEHTDFDDQEATQKGLYRHFKTVADSVKVPAILYNVPSRTGCNILPETVVKLCKDVENIVGVKEASGNISQIAHLAAIGQGVVDIYSGNDDQIVPILALGGVGVISVLSNVAPTQTHEICQKFFDGDVAGSRQMQLDAMDLCNALFCEVNPIPVKTALNMMGMGAGAFRMPLCEMEEANAKRLEKALKDYGVL